MKKNLLLSSIIIGGALNAQITLTQANHAPANLDTYTMNPVGTATVSPGAAGTGVTWNMSTMVITSTISTFTATNSSNATYTPANIVVNNNSGESSYYQSSAANLKYFGGNIVISGIPSTITYTTGAFYALYPMSLSTNTTAAIGGTLSALSNNGTFTGNCKTTADGTGTLMLPGKTYTNVLRVLTTQTINFAVPGIGVTSGVLNQDTYNYYIPGRKSPILSIVTSTAVAPPIAATPSSQTVTTVAADYLLTVGINESAQSITDLSVFPNPSNNFINLTTQNSNAASVVVYDLTGKKLESHNFENGNAGFKTCCLAPGIYIYSIKDNNNQTLTSGKFSVVH
jgi:hypothetical protein